MKDAAVLSRQFNLEFVRPLFGKEVEEGITGILNGIARHLSYRGKILGHIKAFAACGENYLRLSLTKPDGIDIKADPAWYQREYGNLSLTVNIIVFGFSVEQLENILERSFRESFLAG